MTSVVTKRAPARKKELEAETKALMESFHKGPGPVQGLPVPCEKTLVKLTKASRRTPDYSSQECIALRAYALFIVRGANHGHDREDWEQAERELSNHS